MKESKTTWLNSFPTLLFVGAAIFMVGCGKGGGSCSTIPDCINGNGSSGDTGDTNPPPPKVGSSGTESGSAAVYTDDGATYVLTPGGTAVNFLTLPNSGSRVGIVSVPQITNTPISVSLNSVSGLSVDPVNDVGMAFNFYQKVISLYKLSTAQEVGTYDTQTVHQLISSALIAGAIMIPDDQTMILATGDGFKWLDYSDPASPVEIRSVPSLQADPTNGVEVMDNFAFDPAFPINGVKYPIIITGGGQNGPAHALEFVDANTGKIYRPDASTAALFPLQNFIVSAAVDTKYHVAILAEQDAASIFIVNLNAAFFDAPSGTYSLPGSSEVVHLTQYLNYTNLAIESTSHLVMMGSDCGGTDTVLGQLTDPSDFLGFGNQISLATLPSDTDDQGNPVTWNGWCGSDGAVAYLTPNDHPTSPGVAMGLWLNATGNHLAAINMLNVLNGTLNPPYNPIVTDPKDIAYFAIP